MSTNEADPSRVIIQIPTICIDCTQNIHLLQNRLSLLFLNIHVFVIADIATQNSIVGCVFPSLTY